jgi:hypothetical protein
VLEPLKRLTRCRGYEGESWAVDDTVSRLVEIVTKRGLKVFVLVDHSVEARAVGLDLRDTQLVLFGSPAAGTPVMTAAPHRARPAARCSYGRTVTGRRCAIRHPASLPIATDSATTSRRDSQGSTRSPMSSPRRLRVPGTTITADRVSSRGAWTPPPGLAASKYSDYYLTRRVAGTSRFAHIAAFPYRPPLTGAARSQSNAVSNGDHRAPFERTHPRSAGDHPATYRRRGGACNAASTKAFPPRARGRVPRAPHEPKRATVALARASN